MRKRKGEVRELSEEGTRPASLRSLRLTRYRTAVNGDSTSFSTACPASPNHSNQLTQFFNFLNHYLTRNLAYFGKPVGVLQTEQSRSSLRKSSRVPVLWPILSE